MNTLNTGLIALAGLGLLALTGCDDASAVETRDRSTTSASVDEGGATTVEAAERRDEAAKPVLTASRSETVDAKTARLYARNGADFDARSAEDYLTKVTAFTTKPPSGTETVKRANGDTLLYQASTNTFAVMARDGTPRTMFKPTTGAAYWAEQKARAPTFGQRRQSTDEAG